VPGAWSVCWRTGTSHAPVWGCGCVVGRARSPPGPQLLLARRTGAPLVPVTLHYEGRDLTITFHPPVPHADGADGLVQMTQAVADAFSGALREHPEDWHMMQKVFVEDLPAAR
jgi:phosphatidylinositol dimannoside acyltransferase